jgi:hypothetical protein
VNGSRIASWILQIGLQGIVKLLRWWADILRHEEICRCCSVSTPVTDPVQRIPAPTGRDRLCDVAVLPISAEAVHG